MIILQASGDLTGATDSANMTAMVARSGAQRQKLELLGEFIMQPPATSSWNWRMIAGNPVYICVPLVSHAHIDASQATFRIVGPASAYASTVGAVGPRVAFFGTPVFDATGSQGIVQDVVFKGGTFDFVGVSAYPFTYAFMVTAIDDFEQRDILFTNTGTFSAAIGRGCLAENTRRRRVTNCTYTNIAQGNYSRYEWDITVTGIHADGCAEVWDFDGPCWRVRMSNMDFRNLKGEAQCIDTGGGSDWIVESITADTVGALFQVYVKQWAWPTYAGWLADTGDVGTASCIIPDNMVFRDIQAVNAGVVNANECFRIGNYRDSSWPAILTGVANLVGTITVENLTIDGGWHATVNECKELILKNIELRNMACPDDTDKGGALVMRQSASNAQNILDSILSGSAEDIRIINSGGTGIICSGASGIFEFSDIVVDGYNTANGTNTKFGVVFNRLGLKSGGNHNILGDMTVKNGQNSGLIDLVIGGSNDGANDYNLVLDGKYRLLTSGATPLQVGGGGTNPCSKIIEKREGNVPTFTPSTTSGSDYIAFQCNNGWRGYVGYAAFALANATVGDAANFSYGRIQTVNAGVRASVGSYALNIDDTTHAQGTYLEFNSGALPSSGALLSNGDILMVNVAKNTGTPVASPSIRYVLGIIPWLSK